MELFSRFVAVLMIVIISPVMLAIGLASLIFQGFPILYKQERIGFKFKSFSLFKFRTMKRNDGKELITNPNDNRITFWGKILRRFKLDELPQLVNIVKGEMRFIGPRPEVRQYTENNNFSFLERIKPGLTDFSSILFRNESKILSRAGGVNTYPQLLELKIELGHLYAKHKSFWLDLKLVVLTLISIILPKTAINLVKKHFINKYNPALIPAIEKWV